MSSEPWFLMAVATLAIGCVRPTPNIAHGDCERIGLFTTDYDAFAEVRERGVPLFVSGGDLWTCPCRARDLGVDEARHAYDGASEMRRVGEDGEERQFGSDAEYRTYGGQFEDRFGGIAGEERSYGGEIARREFGGGSEVRRTRDASESRSYGRGDQARLIGIGGQGFQCSATPECATYGISGGGPLRVVLQDAIVEVAPRCAGLYVASIVSDAFATTGAEPDPFRVSPPVTAVVAPIAPLPVIAPVPAPEPLPVIEPLPVVAPIPPSEPLRVVAPPLSEPEERVAPSARSGVAEPPASTDEPVRPHAPETPSP